MPGALHVADAAEIAAAHARVAAASAELRALSMEDRTAAIARAARRVSDVAGAERSADAEVATTLTKLADGSGLSRQGVAWGLSTTLSIFTTEALAALGAEAAARPAMQGDAAPPVTLVLAGNVFTACARPLLLPLLCGVGVVAKASSRDDALAVLLRDALRSEAPQLGAACEVLVYRGGDASLDGALLGAGLAAGGPINVYGSDETVAALTALARGIDARGRVIGHGHGLGLCYVGADAVSEATARAVALDVGAYDQRGCLSPQGVFVEGDGARFAALLHAALDEREMRCPRGALPPDAAAAQTQWRGVAAAIGTLHAGAAHAVSHEGRGALRAGPGYRNVAVHDCDGVEAFAALATRFGRQLKAVGIAGQASESAREGGALAGLAPYVCAAGEMQAPGLAVELDGLGVLEGVGVG